MKKFAALLIAAALFSPIFAGETKPSEVKKEQARKARTGEEKADTPVSGTKGKAKVRPGETKADTPVSGTTLQAQKAAKARK